MEEEKVRKRIEDVHRKARYASEVNARRQQVRL